MGYTSKLSAEDHKKSKNFAIIAYVGVMMVFMTIIAVAVTVTMQQEASKTSFKAIKVSKPISFFDKTYMNDEASKTTPIKEAK